MQRMREIKMKFFCKKIRTLCFLLYLDPLRPSGTPPKGGEKAGFYINLYKRLDFSPFRGDTALAVGGYYDKPGFPIFIRQIL